MAYATRRQTYDLHMAAAPLITYDPAAKKATAKRLDEHSVYLSLEGGGVGSFSRFTEEEIGDPGVRDDEAVIDYFQRLLEGTGWNVSRSDTAGPDDQIATWLLAPRRD